MATGGLKLLFDENFSHKQVEFVARESRLAEMQHMRKIKWSGRPDAEWIPLAVKGQFVIVTADRNERTRGYTVSDLKTMDARVLLLGSFWDHLSGWERAKWLVNRIEAIVEAAGALGRGQVWMIERFGRANQI